MAAGLYAGTTLADDGSPILLLDPSGIAKRAGITLAESELHQVLREAEEEAEAERETSLLLFRTLAGGRRAVPVMLVERIEDVPAEAISFGAGKLRVAIGERILPLAGCEAAPAEGKLRILRLTDGAFRDRLRLRRGDRHPLAPARSPPAPQRRARWPGSP